MVARLLGIPAVAVALVIAACGTSDDPETASSPVAEGGQTGSAGCKNPPDCVCDAVRSAIVLRGVVAPPPAPGGGTNDAGAFDPSAQVAVEVSSVLSPNTGLEPGATIQGSFQRALPCGVGSSEPLPEGTEVLVSFEPQGMNEATTSLTGHLYLIEWAETLQLTDEVVLPRNDVAILVDIEACRERFASTEPIVCDNFF